MLKFNSTVKIVLFGLMVFFGGQASAGTVRYVNDQLVITLRAGQGDHYRVVRPLVSGTRLEVLEEQGAFARVLTPTGEEGWVRTQYLVGAPVARLLLKEASDRATRLEQEWREMRDQLKQQGGGGAAAVASERAGAGERPPCRRERQHQPVG